MASHNSWLWLRPVRREFQAAKSKATNFSANAPFFGIGSNDNYCFMLREESISAECVMSLHITFKRNTARIENKVYLHCVMKLKLFQLKLH